MNVIPVKVEDGTQFPALGKYDQNVAVLVVHPNGLVEILIGYVSPSGYRD